MNSILKEPTHGSRHLEKSSSNSPIGEIGKGQPLGQGDKINSLENKTISSTQDGGCFAWVKWILSWLCCCFSDPKEMQGEPAVFEDKTLTLFSLSEADYKKILETPEKIQKLNLIIPHVDSLSSEGIRLIELVKQIPKLRKLTVHGSIDVDLLTKMMIHSPGLRVIQIYDLDWSSSHWSKFLEGRGFPPELRGLDLFNCKGLDDGHLHRFSSLKNLEHLDLSCSSDGKSLFTGKGVLKLIQANPNLRTLILSYQTGITDEEHFQIAQAVAAIKIQFLILDGITKLSKKTIATYLGEFLEGISLVGQPYAQEREMVAKIRALPQLRYLDISILDTVSFKEFSDLTPAFNSLKGYYDYFSRDPYHFISFGHLSLPYIDNEYENYAKNSEWKEYEIIGPTSKQNENDRNQISAAICTKYEVKWSSIEKCKQGKRNNQQKYLA
jgi:hypothetical protein